MKRARATVEMYRELAPLAEASAIAYHVLVEHPKPPRDRGELLEVRFLMARALAAIAPILRKEGEGLAPLGAPEINAALYKGPGRADLAGLYVRRVDLLRAVEALRLAGFGDPQRGAKDAAAGEAGGPDDRRGGLAPVEAARDPAEDG